MAPDATRTVPLPEPAPPPAFGRLGMALLAVGGLALLGAGLLLWSVQGPAVFNDVVLAALAWCF